MIGEVLRDLPHGFIENINTIIYIVVFLIGTFVMYQFGLIPYWQVIRQEKKLVSKRSLDYIGPFDKNPFGKLAYIFPCALLLFFSMLISGTIITISFLDFSGDVTQVKTSYRSIFSVVAMYAIILDVSVTTEGIIDKNRTKVFGYVYVIISWFKRKLISYIVYVEMKEYRNTVSNLIDDWHKDWVAADKDESYRKKANLSFGIMLMHIDSEYLSKKIPFDCQDGIRSKFMNLKHDLVVQHEKSVSIMVDLKAFFRSDIFDAGVAYEDAMEIFQDIEHNNDLNKYSFDEIKQYLQNAIANDVKKSTKKMVDKIELADFFINIESESFNVRSQQQ